MSAPSAVRSVPSLEAVPSARRGAIAELLIHALRVERELEAVYALSVPRARFAPLAEAFAELGRGKAAHASTVARLVPAFGAGTAASPPPSPTTLAESGHAAVLAHAFRGERELEGLYREAVAVLGDPSLCPDLLGLAAGAARHRARLRRLYLRYS